MTTISIPTTTVAVTDSGTTVALTTTTTTAAVDIGTTGPQGATGPGVPAGGTAGQVIVKDSGTDYDTSWTSAPSGLVLAQSQVTSLTTDLAAKLPTSALPYIAVVPFSVRPIASSGTLTVTALTAMYGGFQTAGTAQNSYFEWDVLLAAGTYELRTVWRGNNASGIASISVDGGAALGTTIDMYAASATSNNVTDIGGIALTAGRHTIRYTGATKNGSSANYSVNLQAFSLTRTGA